MKSPYVADLQPNQVATGVFLVQYKDIRYRKSGEPYLTMMLADRTGEVDTKMWDGAAQVMDAFDRDDFVRSGSHRGTRHPHRWNQNWRPSQYSADHTLDFAADSRRL